MADSDEKKSGEFDPERQQADNVSLGQGDILSQEATDPVLNAKMHLVNNVRCRFNCFCNTLPVRDIEFE